MNLCINSRDAMPGGGVLSVETYQTFLACDDVRLNIDAHEGVAGFLGKPYQINELLDKVRAALESRTNS